MPTIDLASVIIAAIATLASIILGAKGYQLQQLNYELQKQKNINERELETLREKMGKFKRDITSYTWPDEPLVADVIFLGPLVSGKSSIAQLWKKPWADIKLLSATTKWEEYLLTIDEFKNVRRKTHPIFEVECNFSTALRLRIRDYSGEDRFRVIAIQELEKLSNKAVILFVMKVGYSNGRIDFANVNSAYFSTAFVQVIRDSLRITGSIAKAIVVFNKIDVLPPTWDAQRMMSELKSANTDSVDQIEKVFSPFVEYRLTSALTNYGLIDLLGTVATALIGRDVEKSTLEQIAERLKKR